VRARFLQHPKQSDEVSLAVVKATNGKQSEEVFSVPLAKLNKQSQDRVAQIDKLLEELEAAASLIPDADTGKKPAQTADTEKPQTDPTGRPRLKPDQLYNNTPWFPDNAKWRTDYKEFVKQLSASGPDATGYYEPNFGNILPLQKRHELATLIYAHRNDSRGKSDFTKEKAALRSEFPTGDVVWECMIIEPDEKTIKEHNLAIDGCTTDLPPLPEPFRLRINHDHDYGWPNLRKKMETKPAKVRFIGTFKEDASWNPGQSMLLELLVRFPDNQPK
jgi:hypothetical protein